MAAGFLNVYKPVGPGSQSLLGPIKRLVGSRRVGHAGTLDPFASGVLVVAVGRATRLIDSVHAFPKSYRAELRLGVETSTDDIEGELLSRDAGPLPTRTQVEAILPEFVGEIQQTPPAYSALKVGGRRAYDVARTGGDLQLAPRTVRIHSVRLLNGDGSVEGGDRLVLAVRCDSGTYVRALGRDIAHRLGTVGHLTALVRTAVGPFHLQDAFTTSELVAAAEKCGLERVLIPPHRALEGLPAVVLSDEEASRLRAGASVAAPVGVDGGESLAAYDGGGRLIGLCRPRGGRLALSLLLE